MNREFTRKELYELVWSQPMRTIAADIGISDVALAKHCKKANIPVPTRGYWARKQAGKSAAQIALPPRFPGASDRIGRSVHQHYYGRDWAIKFIELPIPSVPSFDEGMDAVEVRVRRLVGKVQYPRKFDPAHPLVGKLLAHDEERRQEFLKWGSSYYAPRYDAGIERRRLLIVNALFLAAGRLGCRPSMSTSKYAQDPRSDRDICITIGGSHIYFTVEEIKPTKEKQKDRLRLALGMARDHSSTKKAWEDKDSDLLENQITDILVDMLLEAETSYRNGLIRHREWIIERKAAAEAELKQQKEEAERQARELQEKLAKERIELLLKQAKALDRANQIRTYVDAVRLRAAELPLAPMELEKWAEWARQEADRIDPVQNGQIEQSVREVGTPGHQTG